MRTMQRGPALVTFLLLAATPCARADLITYNYSWDPIGGAVVGGSGPSTAVLTAGKGDVLLTGESLHTAVGDTKIVAASLQTESTAGAGSPDTFALNGGVFGLQLTLFDPSGATGKVSFFGQLQGSFSKDNANVTGTFFAPVSQPIILGTNQYTVTLQNLTPPGPPSETNLGGINALIQVQSLVLHPTSLTPEPASLSLAGLGVVAAGLVLRRRKR